MKLVLSLSALGLIGSGAAAVSTQSSCASPKPCATTLAANSSCSQATPLAISVAAAPAQGDKVAARAAELEALAGEQGLAESAQDEPAGISTKAPQQRQPRVFRYEGGTLTPAAPSSVATPRAPAAPRAPSAPHAPAAPHAAAQPCAPCPATPACPPCPPCEPSKATPAAPHSQSKAHGSVANTEQWRAQVERQLATAREAQEHARQRMREALGHQREAQQRAREEVERARERSQTQTKRALEQAERAAIIVRDKAAQERAAQAKRGGSGPSERELELERRVRELEARLMEVERSRGGQAGPGVHAPAAPHGASGLRSRAHAPAAPSSKGGASGGTRIRARAVAPNSAGGLFFETSPESDDRECNPSRVRVLRMPAGKGTVVVPGDLGGLVDLDGLDIAVIAPDGSRVDWGENIAKWAEEFAHEQAQWAEEFARAHAGEWSELALEHWEDVEDAWDSAWERYEDQLEEAQELEEELREDAEEAAEEAAEAAAEAEELQREAAERTRDARLVPHVVRGEQNQALAPLAALSLLGKQDPLGLSRLANYPGESSTDQLRSAVNEMQSEVDGLRAALRELREQLEQRKRTASF